MFHVTKEITQREFEVRASGRVPRYLILDQNSYREFLATTNAKHFFVPASEKSHATYYGWIVSVLPGTENSERYVEVI